MDFYPSKTLLPILLGEFHQKITSLNSLVPRQASFPIVENKIKVAIGMRRVGKTYFIYQYILSLLQANVPLTRILYLNFEDDRLYPLDKTQLASFIEAFYSLYPENHDNKCYLFLDEIQNVTDWPLVIRRFYDTKNVEIFLTGSSAKLLSKEIATTLRGRSLSTEIWPYSFKEFLSAKQIDIDKTLFDKKTQDILFKYFNEYLRDGGFPEIIHYPQDAKLATLQEYVDVVIYRDLIERHGIKNTSVIKHMILSMIHNAGNIFSINKFYNELKSRGFKISKDLLYDYASYIEDAYLVFGVGLYDWSIRKVQANPQKLYLIDPGLVRATTLAYEKDLGKLFENIIYLELRRLGCSIHYYLTKERYEVDFLIQTPNKQKKLFQVVWDMQDTATYNREMRALQTAEKELKISGEIITLESYLQHGIIF